MDEAFMSAKHPSSEPGAVRDAAGNWPEEIAGYPGARGVREAVFVAGPGKHTFTGPALPDTWR